MNMQNLMINFMVEAFLREDFLNKNDYLFS